MVQGMIIFSKSVHYGTKYDVIIRTLALWYKVWSYFQSLSIMVQSMMLLSGPCIMVQGMIIFSKSVHYGTKYDVIIGTWIYITIAISWEYPNKLEGVAWGCNTILPNDSANFLLFLVQVLQSTVERLILSASVGITPFNSPDGDPMTDVSAFSKVLNYIGKYFIS